MLHEEPSHSSLKALCGLFGYSRQSFYKSKDDNDFAEEAIVSVILKMVKDYRHGSPCLGCAKLYVNIKKLLKSEDCMPGRDRFIELLRAKGLMVQIKRRRHFKTTDSNHHYHMYDNLIKGIEPMRPNEIWVSDITYVVTDEGVCYLSLITDAYSRKIVGWAVGPTLETIYPLEALRMALATIDDKTAAGLIHHSDRGCQYCSTEYVAELKKHHIRISMTQSGDPLENAIAERVNGILKTEWLYKMKLPNIKVCRKKLEQIIYLYNNVRPHMSIGMQTPEVAHGQTGVQKKCWRNPWDKPKDEGSSE